MRSGHCGGYGAAEATADDDNVEHGCHRAFILRQTRQVGAVLHVQQTPAAVCRSGSAGFTGARQSVKSV